MDKTNETLQDCERKPWDQMPGEPDRWFGRFKVYLELGPTRTCGPLHGRQASRAGINRYTKAANGRSSAANGSWRHAPMPGMCTSASCWPLSERNTRLALHSRRVERMEDYLDAVCEVLDAANMTAADEQLAREWLPQMRVFLRDLLVAERQEFERGDYEQRRP